ncbi:MAG: hypothetical protein GWN77_02370 [Gammaproteobacteria bacterium]|nr:hypothetical protein [Gammaproteobacteria bacterium]
MAQLTLPFSGTINDRRTAFSITNSGLGGASKFDLQNNNNRNPTIEAATLGYGPALKAINMGNKRTFRRIFPFIPVADVGGPAGHFEINHPENNRSAIVAVNNGVGGAGDFQIQNKSSNAAALSVRNSGTGTAGFFVNFHQPYRFPNPPPADAAITAINWTTGAPRRGIHLSLPLFGGPAGYFKIAHRQNNNAAVFAETDGFGSAGFFTTSTGTNPSPSLVAITKGHGHAGYFEVNSTDPTRPWQEPALEVRTNGRDPAIKAENTNDSDGIAFRAISHSRAATLWASMDGAGHNIAIFSAGGRNQARIDSNGRGFFNGGTRNSGADIAEALGVEGLISSYDPGDVLVISEKNDCRIEKSSESYSTLVAGVYATKPGVILTERGIDETLEDTAPVGVLGVIHTKVSGENGPIRRGDLLVTSNTPGHAMKGTDQSRMLGAVIGKALENFDGSGRGVIKVLVTLK